MLMLALSLLSSCASEPAVIEGDPYGMPLEIDVGTYSVRAATPQGQIVAVVVVSNTGPDTFTEDWYLSPLGSTGTYAPYIKPSAANPAVTQAFVYASAATTNPPTNPAPAAGAIKWRHAVTKIQ